MTILEGRLNQTQMTALNHQVKTFLWNRVKNKYPGDVAIQAIETELSNMVTGILNKFGIDHPVQLYIRRCSEITLNVHVMDGLPTELQMMLPGCPYCHREKEKKHAPKDNVDRA